MHILARACSYYSWDRAIAEARPARHQVQEARLAYWGFSIRWGATDEVHQRSAANYTPRPVSRQASRYSQPGRHGAFKQDHSAHAAFFLGEPRFTITPGSGQVGGF